MQFDLNPTIKVLTTLLITYCLFFSHSSLAKTSQANSLSIYLKEMNVTLSYPKPTRLSQVLTDANQQLSYTPYLLASTLIDTSQEKNLHQKKQHILAMLSKLNNIEAKHLYKQLSSLHFKPKINITLDMDLVRTFLTKNPLLKGEYELSLPPRPNKILIIGNKAVNPVYTDIIPNSSLKDYLQPLVFSSNSESDYPWVIQADQTIYQISDTFWKGNKTFLSPGATIFIGLRNLPKKFNNLNQQIAQLLAHHVEK